MSCLESAVLGHVEGIKSLKHGLFFFFRGVDQVFNTCYHVSGSMLDALHTLIHLILKNVVT